MITYERAMLTLIAASMVGLLYRDITRHDIDVRTCGEYEGNACHIRSSKMDPIKVEVVGIVSQRPLPVSVENTSTFPVPVSVSR